MTQITIRVDLNYDIPNETLPPYATPLGVEAMIEHALGDYNKPFTLDSFEEILRLKPASVDIHTVLT